MVAFLEKHFEFTTTLSMNECIERLQSKSNRETGWLVSKRDILVRITDDGDNKKFMLDRDAGRGLYAEVYGKLSENTTGSVHVAGYGQIPLRVFWFMPYFFIVSCFFTYVFRGTLWSALSTFLLLVSIPSLIVFLRTARNRDHLITIVREALETKQTTS